MILNFKACLIDKATQSLLTDRPIACQYTHGEMVIECSNPPNHPSPMICRGLYKTGLVIFDHVEVEDGKLVIKQTKPNRKLYRLIKKPHSNG